MQVNHKNVEKVIRYYLQFLPPKECESIIDLGSGITTPYRAILSNRTKRYIAVDIRESDKVDYVLDILDGLPFNTNEFSWGWCTETIEHVSQGDQQNFLDICLRVCKNFVLTYPTPKHQSFYDDPGHHEVYMDLSRHSKKFKIYNKTTKTGRAIFVFKER